MSPPPHPPAPPPSDVRAELDAHGLTDLVREICRRRGITLDELCGTTRTRSISRARHETWAAIHALPHRHYSYAEIGRLFGRDHSTVLLGIRVHRRRASPSASVAEDTTP